MQLVDVIEKTVAGLGYELVDFETSPRARLLRVFIGRPVTGGDTDGPGKGIGVDDCAEVSHQLTRVLAVENIDYDRLEVSSPGLDRPLKKAGDFERFSGSEIQLKLRLPLGNQRNFSGVLEGLRDGKICLATADARHEFDLANVDKARLVPKF